MTVYVLAQLWFKDDVTPYRRYQERFMEVLKQYGGRLLIADEQPRVLEGEWNADKVVLLSFTDESAYVRWAQSSEYQTILRDRKAGADALVLLAQGVN